MKADRSSDRPADRSADRSVYVFFNTVSLWTGFWWVRPAGGFGRPVGGMRGLVVQFPNWARTLANLLIWSSNSGFGIPTRCSTRPR